MSPVDKPISTNEAFAAFNTLRSYFQTQGCSESGYNALHEFERILIQNKTEANSTQSRLPNFFKLNLTLK